MAARILAQSRWPYISHLLFSLRIVPPFVGTLETLAVDAGWRLYFNEAYVLRVSVADLATDLQHEAMHCIFNHHERFVALRDPEPNHKLFNIAGDCGINHVIENCGFRFAKDFPPVRFRDFPKINSDRCREVGIRRSFTISRTSNSTSARARRFIFSPRVNRSRSST